MRVKLRSNNSIAKPESYDPLQSQHLIKFSYRHYSTSHHHLPLPSPY